MPPIGNCPTWSYHGSKATIAKWIVSHFPNDISHYYEPFAGRANVFFRLVTTPGYFVANTTLNDKYNAHWFRATISYNGDWGFIPAVVNQEVFEQWNNSPPSIERDLAEPIVCYHSNRYNMNSAASSDKGSLFYSENFAKNWLRKYLLTQKILKEQRVSVKDLDYKEFFDTHTFTEKDVVYLDPPYLAPYDEKRTYPNIEHIRLLDIIKTLPCRVYISNYSNPLYEKELSGWNLATKIRVSAAKGRQLGHAGGRTEKLECLWFNK